MLNCVWYAEQWLTLDFVIFTFSAQQKNLNTQHKHNKNVACFVADMTVLKVKVSSIIKESLAYVLKEWLYFAISLDFRRRKIHKNFRFTTYICYYLQYSKLI